MSFRRTVLSFGGLAAAYALVQGLNLLSQAFLLRTWGGEWYAQIGLAQVALSLVIFLGDLGYGLYFQRELCRGTSWKVQWAGAQGNRVIFLVAGYLATFALWRERTPWVTTYLLWAGPGVILSIFNLTPLFVARHQGERAGLGTLMLGGVQAMGVLLALLIGNRNVAPRWMGIGLSLGYLLQAAIHLRFIGIQGLWRVSFFEGSWSVFLAAIRLWSLALVGSLYDRTLPFFVAMAGRAFLPYFLFLSTLLQGVSTMISQATQVMLPHFVALRSQEDGERTSSLLGGFSALLCGGLMVFLPLAFPVVLSVKMGLRDHLPSALQTVSAWAAPTVLSMTVPAILAFGLEGKLLRLLVVTNLIGALTQFLVAPLSLQGLFLVRVAIGIGTSCLCFHLVKARIPRRVLLGLLFVYGLAFGMPWSIGVWVMVFVWGAFLMASSVRTLHRTLSSLSLVG